MLSIAPSLRLVLEDSEFAPSGQPAWTTERALDFAHHKGVEAEIPAVLQALAGAMERAPYPWFAKRLGVLWTMFMVGRSVDDRDLTVWMAEAANLLCDLPHDIVAFAIDEAIRKSPHGFIPSVGEIRRHADPLAAERRQHIERLERMKAALEDGAATAARSQRRAQQDAHRRDMARFEK
ncbi:hypothetical protein [Novosphingobium resinovorum]|uniref:hypothetical protein n=1 Tax=Novosphingobium resinovorum TaxID=158500 RepID=UPI002ED13B70|nr:hypothetical protein [Novosphingobium resinovorum]